jgi:uncharacterized membrane protein
MNSSKLSYVCFNLVLIVLSVLLNGFVKDWATFFGIIAIIYASVVIGGIIKTEDAQ